MILTESEVQHLNKFRTTKRELYIDRSPYSKTGPVLMRIPQNAWAFDVVKMWREPR